MKVVINSDYGGFGLSDEAFEEYLNRKGIAYTKELNSYGGFHFYENGPEATGDDVDLLWEGDLDRSDPVLVEIVEKLGTAANGKYSSLKVVDIPEGVDWYIEEYDGREHIAERHRTWS